MLVRNYAINYQIKPVKNNSKVNNNSNLQNNIQSYKNNNVLSEGLGRDLLFKGSSSKWPKELKYIQDEIQPLEKRLEVAVKDEDKVPLLNKIIGRLLIEAYSFRAPAKRLKIKGDELEFGKNPSLDVKYGQSGRLREISSDWNKSAEFLYGEAMPHLSNLETIQEKQNKISDAIKTLSLLHDATMNAGKSCKPEEFTKDVELMEKLETQNKRK